MTLFIQKGRRIPDLPRDFFLSTEEQNYPDQEKLARIERDANLINDEKWNEVDFTPYTGTKRDIIQLLIRVRDIHNSKTLKEIKQIEDTSFFSLTAGKGFFKSESYHKMQAIFASRLRNEKPDDDSSQSDANKNLPALTEDEMYLVQQATYALSALAGYPQTNVGAVQDNANVEAKAGVRKGIHEQPVTFIGWNIASPQVVLSLKNFCRIVQNKKIPVKERYYALYNFFDTILHEITHFSDKDNMSHEAEGIIDDAFITRFKSLIEKFIRSELSPEKFLDFLKDSVKDKNINPLEYDFSLPEYTRNIKRRNLLAKAA
ncbi:MAG: hypothetical protein ACD_79C00416G0003 [uncultured bacterium]|nr:MAG: hypothetical protein ACD_79C00416G0003 [uncultured bacterium]